MFIFERQSFSESESNEVICDLTCQKWVSIDTYQICHVSIEKPVIYGTSKIIVICSMYFVLIQYERYQYAHFEPNKTRPKNFQSLHTVSRMHSKAIQRIMLRRNKNLTSPESSVCPPPPALNPVDGWQGGGGNTYRVQSVNQMSRHISKKYLELQTPLLHSLHPE